jgi:hypothetical protein
MSTRFSKEFDGAWPEHNEDLARALSIGLDYTGYCTFYELQIVAAHGRHRVVSAYRLTTDNLPNHSVRYEVVLVVR